jgi:hypothetical protein
MCVILYMKYAASAIRKPVNANLRIEILNGFPMRLQRYRGQSHTAAVVRTLPHVASHGLSMTSEALFTVDSSHAPRCLPD